MKKLFLVDASNMFFRAYYAIRHLSNSKGFPTNALYGYMAMTIKLLREMKPDYMAYCFDSKESNFRVQIYPEYKANRTEMPDDLIPQMPYFQKLTKALGIPIFKKPGVEADDLIGSLVQYSRNKQIEVTIISGDKDFAQLVDPMTKILDTMKDKTYDVIGVKEKWGIRPDQMIDYLALIGDSSDNIPGIKGIGPKTAQKLLDEFSSLDEIYKNIDQIKNVKQKEKILFSKEIAYLSKKLVTIQTDIDLLSSMAKEGSSDEKDVFFENENENENENGESRISNLRSDNKNFPLESLKLKPIAREGLQTLLDELEFNSFEKKIFGKESENTSKRTSQQEEKVPSKLEMSSYQISKDTYDLHFRKKDQSSKDLDKKDLRKNPIQNDETIEKSEEGASEIVEEEQMSLSSDINSLDESVLNSHEVEISPQDLQKILRENQEVWTLTNNRGLVVSFDSNVYLLKGEVEAFQKVFDSKNINWKGCGLKTFWKSVGLKKPRAHWDQEIAYYVLDAMKYMGEFEEIYEEVFSKKPPDFPTGAELLKMQEDLKEELYKRLQEKNSLKVLEKLDIPLIEVLYSMESYGVLLDQNLLAKQSRELHEDIRKLELGIYDFAEETFNIASTKQLSHILFDKLKLTPLRKTKTGYSTDSDVLNKLKNDHPICELVIEYRELSKLKSTYVDSLPLLVDPKDGRIHTSFHQTVTSTGRLSSSNPNLQNIPIRTKRGNAIRGAFIAERGYELISSDYSQIELRVLAHITEDPGLVRAFENDLDIHAATASEVFGVKIEDVTSDLRRIAKAVNFGLAYGMGAYGLAENLSISRSEASSIIENYFKKFPKVKSYMTDVVEVAKQKGFVQTIFGRRRYAPELKSKSGVERNFGERAIINAPMQGTASDIVKKAMIELYGKCSAQMILQVHDELIFEAKKEKVEEYKIQIKDIMENIVKLKVPLKVNISSGPSWLEAH